jgi:transcriptional regulator with XRE-family HTH domain
MEPKERSLSRTRYFEKYRVALGFVLNHARKQRGLTVKEVARRARIKAERLDAIEAGTDETIDLQLILDLASALNVDSGAVMRAAELHIRGKSRKGGIAKKRRNRTPRSRTGTR